MTPRWASSGWSLRRIRGRCSRTTNAATYTLGAILQRLTGQTLRDYLTPRLFDPLGITPGPWDQHPSGRDLAFTGLHLPTEALARFGQLYLQGGRWQGRQVLPAGWAELATRHHTPNPDEPNPDWRQGYGFQFWRGRHGSVRGDGAFGQFCLLLPDQDAVLATTAGTENMQGLLDAVWTHLLPALGGAGSAEAGSAEADDRLADRLSTLRLDPAQGAATSERPGDGIAVTEVQAAPDGWAVTLQESGLVWTVDVGATDWRRSSLPVGPDRGLAVAARGRATDDGLEVDLVLTQTPHRLRLGVRLDPLLRTVTWCTAPLLSPRLAALATPTSGGAPAGGSPGRTGRPPRS